MTRCPSRENSPPSGIVLGITVPLFILGLVFYFRRECVKEKEEREETEAHLAAGGVKAPLNGIPRVDRKNEITMTQLGVASLPTAPPPYPGGIDYNMQKGNDDGGAIFFQPPPQYRTAATNGGFTYY